MKVKFSHMTCSKPGLPNWDSVVSNANDNDNDNDNDNENFLFNISIDCR